MFYYKQAEPSAILPIETNRPNKHYSPQCMYQYNILEWHNAKVAYARTWNDMSQLRRNILNLLLVCLMHNILA